MPEDDHRFNLKEILGNYVQNPQQVLIKNIACHVWSDKRGVKYFKKFRTRFQEKLRKDQKEKSKAKKPENPLKQNQKYHRKKKKNKNKQKITINQLTEIRGKKLTSNAPQHTKYFNEIMEGLQIINGECSRKMQWNGFMAEAAAQNNRDKNKDTWSRNVYFAYDVKFFANLFSYS